MKLTRTAVSHQQDNFDYHQPQRDTERKLSNTIRNCVSVQNSTEKNFLCSDENGRHNNVIKELKNSDIEPAESLTRKHSEDIKPVSYPDDHLFSFINEKYIQEAQEFRDKGYNSQIPEIDLKLLTQLREAVTTAKSRPGLQTSVEGAPDFLWLQAQIGKIERLTHSLSDGCIQGWVDHEVTQTNKEVKGETSLGGRSAAQSLVRRLESTLQVLIRVVHTLCVIDDCSTPEKRHNMLVAELTDALSPCDVNTVMQALEKMMADGSGNAAWSSLVQARTAAWEADKAAAFSTMLETTQHEAEKANKKARELQGGAQVFFSDIAEYLQNLSRDLANTSLNVSQSVPPRIIRKVNDDEEAAPLSRSDSFTQRMKTGLARKNLQLHSALASGRVHAHRLTRILRYGHATEIPPKEPQQVIAGSIARSILWQWQQLAIKIQYASGALLSKVDTLQKTKEMLRDYAVAHDKGNKQEGHDVSATHPDPGDIDAQVRQWVNDSIEQEKPESKLAEKVAVQEQLLKGNIANARKLVMRLGKTEENIQNQLQRLRFAVLKMASGHLSVAAPFLKTIDTLMPDMARNLTASIVALDDALQAAEDPVRGLTGAKKQAASAQLLATKIKETLSAESARLTERPLDEYSRGSRLAKYWANLAREKNPDNHSPVDAKQVLSSLKKQGISEGILSAGDPEGFLFATRLASEFENARNGELILPMSPEQYTALEKDFVEYLVKWGQKRLTRAGTRMVIELSFEQALDAVTFNLSNFIRVPYKILKASIKIPYSLNRVNNYTMPGQDKPYKAIYDLLGKKLTQLGFNLMTAPVPGAIKLAAGAGVTAGALLYNLHIKNSEKSFSEIYQRVTEGKHSKKIKMGSLGGMGLDSVIDGVPMTVFKGAHSAGQSGDSESSFFRSKEHPSKKEVLSKTQSDKEKLIVTHGANLILRGEETFIAAIHKHIAELQKHASGRAVLEGLAGKTIEIRPPHHDDLLREEDDGSRYFASRVIGESIYFDPYNTYYGVDRKVDTEAWRDVDPSIVLFHELMHIHESTSRHDAIIPSDPTRLDENDYRKEFYESKNLPVIVRHLSENENDDNHYGSTNDKKQSPALTPDIYSNTPYKDLSDDMKKATYLYGIKQVLLQIENDEAVSQNIRNNAYLARIGVPLLVPADISGYNLNNTFLLPDSPDSKSGILVSLNAEIPYYHISKGSDLLETIKLDMPYNSLPIKSHLSIKTPWLTHIHIVSGVETLDKIRDGSYSFERFFNHKKPKPMDIANLSAYLARIIEDDYKHRTTAPTNSTLIVRAVAGSRIPDQEVNAKPVDYKIKSTWAKMAPADYLRSFAKPFSILSGEVQLIVSDMKGEDIQETERNVQKDEYIGSWVDVSAGAILSLSPEGRVFNAAQQVADITADLVEGKVPSPLAVAALIAGCIPGEQIAAKVGKFTHLGGKAVKYGMMIGNKAIDLAFVGTSIKTAVDSGEPLAIYQALLASGMSVKDSYHMAKHMSSTLKIKRIMEDSAALGQLEAIQKNDTRYSLGAEIPARTFKFGQKTLQGRINKGEIEISTDNGETWKKGSKIHLLAFRLQNAGGGNRLPDIPTAQTVTSVFNKTQKDILQKIRIKDMQANSFYRLQNNNPSYYGSGKLIQVVEGNVQGSFIEMGGEYIPVRNIRHKGQGILYEIYDRNYPAAKGYPVEWDGTRWLFERKTSVHVSEDLENLIDPVAFSGRVNANFLSAPDYRGLRYDVDGNRYIKIKGYYIKIKDRDELFLIKKNTGENVFIEFKHEKFSIHKPKIIGRFDARKIASIDISKLDIQPLHGYKNIYLANNAHLYISLNGNHYPIEFSGKDRKVVFIGSPNKVRFACIYDPETGRIKNIAEPLYNSILTYNKDLDVYTATNIETGNKSFMRFDNDKMELADVNIQSITNIEDSVNKLEFKKFDLYVPKHASKDIYLSAHGGRDINIPSKIPNNLELKFYTERGKVLYGHVDDLHDLVNGKFNAVQTKKGGEMVEDYVIDFDHESQVNYAKLAMESNKTIIRVKEDKTANMNDMLRDLSSIFTENKTVHLYMCRAF